MDQLMKEQNKYDQMPASLLDRLQRILPLADKVGDEIVSKETEILELGPDHHLHVGTKR